MISKVYRYLQLHLDLPPLVITYLFLSVVTISGSVFAIWVTEKGYRAEHTSPTLQNVWFPKLSKASGLWTDLKLSFGKKNKVPEFVKIVDIDEKSLEQIGRWPWRRDFLAVLIDSIFEQGARLLVMDMIFPEPQESIPEELKEILLKRKMQSIIKQYDFDKTLSESIQKHRDQIVLGFMSEAPCRPRFSSPSECPIQLARDKEAHSAPITRRAGQQLLTSEHQSKTPLVSAPTVTANIEAVEAATRFEGFVNNYRDSDGVVRRSNLFLMVDGYLLPSLALQAAQVFRNETVSAELNQALGLKKVYWNQSKVELPVQASGLMPIGFYGESYSFEYVSAADVLAVDASSRQLASATPLRNAVVFLGVSALAVSDVVATSVAKEMPGVEVQATLFSNLLRQEATTSHRLSSLILLLIALSGSVLCWLNFKVSRFNLFVLNGLLLLILFVTDWFFLFQTLHQDWNTIFLYIEILVLFVLAVSLKYLTEEQEKSFLRSAFGKYVSPTLVDTLVKDHSALSLGGKRDYLGLFFCDIRNFTSYSETMSPQKVGQFLINFHSTVTDIIFKHQGTLDKYIGDAVMAFWGAPLPHPNAVESMFQATYEILSVLREKKSFYLDVFGIDLKVGIGLNAGDVHVGNLGSESAFGYTVIGDEVNLASRLEGATKYFGLPCLFTENVYQRLTAATKTNAPIVYLGKVIVKGRLEPVKVYALCDWPEPLRAQWSHLITQLEEFKEVPQDFNIVASSDEPIFKLLKFNLLNIDKGSPFRWVLTEK